MTFTESEITSKNFGGYYYKSVLIVFVLFEFSYAYTGRPVVVVNATSTFNQQVRFGFELFKNLSNNKLLTPCQFFPYKTEFNTLEEALAMDERRAVMASGYAPWYIGWYVYIIRIKYYI